MNLHGIDKRTHSIDKRTHSIDTVIARYVWTYINARLDLVAGAIRLVNTDFHFDHCLLPVHACKRTHSTVREHILCSLGPRSLSAAPSPTLSPTDPVPRGLLTLCPVHAYAYTLVCVCVCARARARVRVCVCVCVCVWWWWAILIRAPLSLTSSAPSSPSPCTNLWQALPLRPTWESAAFSQCLLSIKQDSHAKSGAQIRDHRHPD